MIIQNQDRDMYYFVKETREINAKPVYYNGVLMGYNLEYENNILGTFNDIYDCISEYYNILHSDSIYYNVSEN